MYKDKFNKWLNQCPIEYEFSNDEKNHATKGLPFAIYFDEVSIESLTAQNKAIKELLSYIRHQVEMFVDVGQGSTRQNNTLKELQQILRKIYFDTLEYDV